MVEIIRKYLPSPGTQTPSGAANPYADDESRLVMLQCSSEAVDVLGDIVVQSGIDLSRFRKNPVVLWQHNQGSPIARALEVSLGPMGLQALVEFPAPGISSTADSVYALVRADIVRGVSIGFYPVAAVPLDKGNPKKGPQKYTKSQLFEISLCSLPANLDGRVAWKFAADGDEAARLKATEAAARRMRQIDVLRLKVPR